MNLHDITKDYSIKELNNIDYLRIGMGGLGVRDNKIILNKLLRVRKNIGEALQIITEYYRYNNIFNLIFKICLIAP